MIGLFCFVQDHPAPDGPYSAAAAMIARALIGGCLLAVVILHPDGAAAQTASTKDQYANVGNDLFRPPANLMMDEYKTAPGSGSAPGTTRDVTTETLNLRMDHSLDLAPMWILALRADLPLVAKNPITSDNPNGDYVGVSGTPTFKPVRAHQHGLSVRSHRFRIISDIENLAERARYRDGRPACAATAPSASGEAAPTISSAKDGC
jgi:hypothetical protein